MSIALRSVIGCVILLVALVLTGVAAREQFLSVFGIFFCLNVVACLTYVFVVGVSPDPAEGNGEYAPDFNKLRERSPGGCRSIHTIR